MKIDIKKETFEFFKNLIHEINTQDNRITASPFLYVIMETKREYGIEEDYGEHGFEWICNGETCHWDTIVEQIQEKNDNYELEVTEDMAEEEDYYKCYYRQTEKISHNFFFTEKACKEHIRVNGHNLRNPQDYVIHAFRNPEIKNIIEGIKEITNQKEESCRI